MYGKEEGDRDRESVSESEERKRRREQEETGEQEARVKSKSQQERAHGPQWSPSKRVSCFVVCTSSTKNPFPSNVHKRPRGHPSSPSLLRTASDIRDGSN